MSGMLVLQRKELIARIILIALFGMFLAACAFHSIKNTDIFFHVQCGLDILAQGKIIVENIYAFTSYGYPFSNHAWLSKVVFALVYQQGGVYALSAVGGLIICALFLPFILAQVRRRTFYHYYCIAVCGVLLMASRFVVRPQLFSFIFFSGYLYVLHGYVRRRFTRAVYLLPILQIAWNQFHAYNILGIVIIGLFVADPIIMARFKHYRRLSRRQLRLWIVWALVIASYVSVHRLDLFIIMYRDLFTVYRSFWFDFISEFLPYEMSIVFLLFLIGTAPWAFRLRRYGDCATLLLYVGLWVWTLSVSRNISFFVLSTLVMMHYRNAHAVPRYVAHKWLPFITRHQKGVLASSLTVMVFLMGLHVVFNAPGFHRSGINPFKVPVGAATFLNEAQPKGRWFCEFAAGSYFVQACVPRTPVFIHNQVEAYDPAFLNAFRRAYQEKEVMGNFIAAFDLRYAVVQYRELGMQMITWFAESPEWVLVYCDGRDLVFVRKGAGNDDIVDRYALSDESTISAEELAALLRSFGPGVQTWFDRLRRHWRGGVFDMKTEGNTIGWRYKRANALAECGLYSHAEKELLACLSEYPSEVSFISHLCALYGLMNDTEKLAAAWQYAQERVPGNQEVRMVYAGALINTGNAFAARDVVRRLAVDGYSPKNGMLQQAKWLYERGRYTEALAYYEILDEYVDEKDELYFVQAEIYAHLEQWEGAREMLERYVQYVDAPSSDALIRLAAIYRNLGHHDNAEALYAQAIAARKREAGR